MDAFFFKRTIVFHPRLCVFIYEENVILKVFEKSALGIIVQAYFYFELNT